MNIYIRIGVAVKGLKNPSIYLSTHPYGIRKGKSEGVRASVMGRTESTLSRARGESITTYIHAHTYSHFNDQLSRF